LPPVQQSERGLFVYDGFEFGTSERSAQAARLAQLVLTGLEDYDSLPSEVAGPHEQGAVLELRATSQAPVHGVATLSPRRLYAGLDAYTRLPQQPLSDHELSFVARADFVDFLHGLALAENQSAA